MNTIARCAALSLLVSPAVTAQQVTLPLDRYEVLERAAHPERAEMRETLGVVLETARMSVRIDKEHAEIDETWDIALFGDGWQSLALPPDRALIATSFGRVEGSSIGGSERTLLVRGRGRSAVELRWLAPLVTDRDATRRIQHLTLDLPRAGAVSGEIAVPEGIDEVEAHGDATLWRNGDRWRFTGEPGARVDLVLVGSGRVATAAQELRFTARIATALSLSRTRVLARSWIDAHVLAGRLGRLELTLPPGLDVVDVKGPIASWKIAERTLSLIPLEDSESELGLEVDLTGAPMTRWSSSLVAVAGSEEEVHLLRGAAEGDGLLRVVDPGDARLAAPDDLTGLAPAFLTAPGPILLVDPRRRLPSWELVWPQGAELLAAQVDRLLYEVAAGADGRAFVRAYFDVRNRGSEHLELEMPAGFVLVDTERDGEAFVPGAREHRLVVPLASRSERQVICVRGIVPLRLPDARGRLELTLPATSVPIGGVEVRLLTPGERPFRVADRTRAGAAGSAPAVARTAGASAETSPQLVATARRQRVRSPFELPHPFGFVETTAAWSALTPRPAALVLVREREKEERSWF